MYGPKLASSGWGHQSHADGGRLEGHGGSRFCGSREGIVAPAFVVDHLAP